MLYIIKTVIIQNQLRKRYTKDFFLTRSIYIHEKKDQRKAVS